MRNFLGGVQTVPWSGLVAVNAIVCYGMAGDERLHCRVLALRRGMNDRAAADLMAGLPCIVVIFSLSECWE